MPLTENPPALVAKAEVESALPGLAEFCSDFGPRLSLARKTSAEARIQQWDLARRIFEYAARADVQARVAAMNRLPGGNVRPGRPKTAHGLVCDELVRREKIGERTLWRWLAEWYRPGNDSRPAGGISILLKLRCGCPQKEFSAIVSGNSAERVEGLLAQLSGQGGADESEDESDPRELGREFAQKIFKFMFRRDDNGKIQPRIRTRAETNAFFREANTQLDALGIPCELVPTGKR